MSVSLPTFQHITGRQKVQRVVRGVAGGGGGRALLQQLLHGDSWRSFFRSCHSHQHRVVVEQRRVVVAVVDAKSHAVHGDGGVARTGRQRAKWVTFEIARQHSLNGQMHDFWPFIGIL